MAMKIYSNTAFVGEGNVKIDKLYFKDGTPVEIIVTSDDDCTGVTIMVDNTKSAEKEKLVDDINIMVNELSEIMRDIICENMEDCDRCLYNEKCKAEMEDEDDE